VPHTSELRPQDCFDILRLYGPKPCLAQQGLFERDASVVNDGNEMPEKVSRSCGLEGTPYLVETKRPFGL
jgi:hypothetical protein